MQRIKEERSLGELFSELSHETQDLLRQEIELAKTELSQKASRTVKDLAFLAIGTAVAYTAFITLVAAIVLAIGTAIAWWLSALIVALVLGGISYSLIQKGIHDLKREDFAPRRTLETLKEDKRWVKNRV